MKLYDDLTNPYATNLISQPEPYELWLAERCVMTNDGNWWIKQRDGHFEEMKSTKTAKHSMRQWAGGNGAMRVTLGDIDSFVKYGAPVVKGGMKVPTSTAPFISVFGHVFVNTWQDTMLTQDDTAWREPQLRLKLQLMFRMIREALCGKSDAKCLDDMIEIINGDDPEEIAFRFTMQWLAAPLQRVGRNLQTNLWHVGELGGTGKGTLSMCMSRVYGYANFCLFNQDEAKQGGWNDSLANALFVNWNEVSQSDGLKFDANSFIKTNTTEDVMQIRKRNTNSFPVLNFANYYFSGNRETCPWGALDFNDRRNAIFAGTDDISKRDLAKELREFLIHQPEQATMMLRGFVYVLRNKVLIDDKLIAFAPDTDIKREMQDAASPEIDGVWWLENADDYPLDTWAHAKDFLHSYQTTMQQGKITPRRFSASILGRLARKKYIEKRRLYDTGRWEYRVSSERFPREGVTRQNYKGPTATKLVLIPPR